MIKVTSRSFSVDAPARFGGIRNEYPALSQVTVCWQLGNPNRIGAVTSRLNPRLNLQIPGKCLKVIALSTAQTSGNRKLKIFFSLIRLQG